MRDDFEADLKAMGEVFSRPAGIELRDLFAGLAMQAMIPLSGVLQLPAGETMAAMSAEAYEMADAMLKARTVKS